MFNISEETCQLDDVFTNKCGDNALCLQNKNNIGVCQCVPSYKLENGKCVRIAIPSSEDTSYNEHLDVVSSGMLNFSIL